MTLRRRSDESPGCHGYVRAWFVNVVTTRVPVVVVEPDEMRNAGLIVVFLFSFCLFPYFVSARRVLITLFIIAHLWTSY